METRDVALLIIGTGIVIVLIGLLMFAGGLNWAGRLPGDIRIERGNTRIFIPITTMILLSVVLTMVLALVRRLL